MKSSRPCFSSKRRSCPVEGVALSKYTSTPKFTKLYKQEINLYLEAYKQDLYDYINKNKEGIFKAELSFCYKTTKEDILQHAMLEVYMSLGRGDTLSTAIKTGKKAINRLKYEYTKDALGHVSDGEYDERLY